MAKRLVAPLVYKNVRALVNGKERIVRMVSNAGWEKEFQLVAGGHLFTEFSKATVQIVEEEVSGTPEYDILVYVKGSAINFYLLNYYEPEDHYSVG